ADTYAGFAGWRSMHGLFLERAICLVRRGGRVGLLLPIQVCDLRGYGPLRLAVTARATVDQPPGLIGEQSFAGVTGPAGLYSFTVGPTGRAAGSNGSAARWAWAPLGRRVEVISAAGVLGRIRQKLAAWPQVPPSAFGDPGVHTGNSAAVLIASTPGPQRAAIRQGSDVGRYHVARPSRWLRLHLRPCDGRYWRIGPLETYRRARLLLRQTADRPIAAWHEPPGYFRNSVLAFFGLAELDEAYVLAVLNSQLIGWMHRCSFRDACQRAFPQVKVEHLRALRLPQEPMGRTSARQRAWIERLWRQCQRACLTSGATDDCDGLVELARAPTVVIQHLLARLGRAMTRLAAAWHAERGRFLARLAEEVRDGPRLQPTSRRSLDRPCREHGERTDSLAALPGCNRLLGSTACWLAEQPPLEAILRALARNGCGVRPARLEQQYGQWLEAQRPIRRRLIRTDRLIDQMVYRLFGLERGEIAAVQDVLRQYAAAQGDCS
ncbi:MAG: TaqI-like C-terminal specificity domain-containing protein, partial [Phycisphaerae bacterium]